jgi:hypothetical protein
MACLERHARLDLLRQHSCNGLIEVRQHLHCELGLDAPAADQVIEGVREGQPDSVE